MSKNKILQLSCWGDSIVQQLLAETLQQKIGISCHNFGLSGDTSSAVMRRMRVESIFYRVADSFEVDGLRSLRLEPSFAGPLESYAGLGGGWKRVTGHFGDAVGELHYDGSDVILDVKDGVPPSPGDVPYLFRPEFRTQSDPSYLVQNPLQYANLLFFGVNNIHMPDRIVSDYGKCVAHLERNGASHIIIMGTLGNWEGLGSEGYNNALKINCALRERFGRYFANVDGLSARDYMISHYNPSDETDLNCHSQDIIPESMRIDGLHLNEVGRDMLTQFIMQYLENQGWI